MNRFVHAVFCDDVRFEVGNKASFMGVYDGVMYVPSLPVTLRNFVVYVSVVTPIEKLFKEVQIELRMGDDVVASFVPDMDQRQALDPRRKGPFIAHYVNGWFAFSPFTIAEQTILRAVAIADGEELLSCGLEVLVGTDFESSSSAAVVQAASDLPA